MPLEVSLSVQMFSQLNCCLFFPSDNRDDQLPRTCAMAFLSRLDAANPLHERLMEDLVISLLKKVVYR